MPLLDVVATTSFNTTFFACFVFLKDKKKEDYEWVLNHIFSLFNGIEKPKVVITDQELALIDTKSLVKSRTESDFEAQWTELSMSGIEGAHAMLKKYLQVSTGNLHTMYEKILLLLENQYNEIKAMISKDKTHILHTQNISFYSRLISKVSLFALRRIHEQYLKVSCAITNNPLKPCNVGSQNRSTKVQASTKRDPSAFKLEETRLNGKKCG
ncbi:19464_t:CDS:2, partial [Racocetra persica]